jgi:hypothetical protein
LRTVLTVGCEFSQPVPVRQLAVQMINHIKTGARDVAPLLRNRWDDLTGTGVTQVTAEGRRQLEEVAFRAPTSATD